MNIKCPYCGLGARLVTGDVIYPHRPDLAALKFWRCAPCDAYVGCHADTSQPKGVPADAALRHARIAAHAAFDPLWRDGSMRRQDAYGWLSERLSIARADCHIGMFNADQCQQVVLHAARYLDAQRRGTERVGEIGERLRAQFGIPRGGNGDD